MLYEGLRIIVGYLKLPVLLQAYLTQVMYMTYTTLSGSEISYTCPVSRHTQHCQVVKSHTRSVVDTHKTVR